MHACIEVYKHCYLSQWMWMNGTLSMPKRETNFSAQATTYMKDYSGLCISYELVAGKWIHDVRHTAKSIHGDKAANIWKFAGWLSCFMGFHGWADKLCFIFIFTYIHCKTMVLKKTVMLFPIASWCSQSCLILEAESLLALLSFSFCIILHSLPRDINQASEGRKTYSFLVINQKSNSMACHWYTVASASVTFPLSEEDNWLFFTLVEKANLICNVKSRKFLSLV